MTEKTFMATQMITLETRLPRNLEGHPCAALNDYAALFSKLSRLYYRQLRYGPVSKKDFMADHGLTGRQFNAIKVSVEGMVQSQLSNLENYITEKEAKAERLAKRINKKKKHTAKPKVRYTKKARKTWDTIQNMQSRVNRLTDQAKNLQLKVDNKQTSICFGSRKLFNAQHHLEKNGYASHDEWKVDWQKARSAQFFVLGSSDESSGNQGCTLIDQHDGLYTLRMRLPNGLESKHGKYAYLTDIEFTYRKDLVEAAVLSNRLRVQEKTEFTRLKKAGKTDKTESQFLSDFGQALSYRFVRDRKGWRVLISTNMKKLMPVKNTKHGVIGLDFNADHVALVETNGKGQKVHLDSLMLAYHQATSRQNRTQMEAIAKEIVTLAVATGKPIVIEKLSFKRKKASLQKGENGKADYHRMLSKLSYKAFRDALTMRAFKEGVAIIEVNPAYTSLIGRLKYGRETKFNTHQAAAWVIARRGQGRVDRIPSKCAIKPVNVTRVFVSPVDGKKTTDGSYANIYKAFSTWCKDERKEWQRIKGVLKHPLRASHSLGQNNLGL